MKLSVKYKLLYLALPVPVSLALRIARTASKGAMTKETAKAIKASLKQTKKDYGRLEIVNIEAENGFKLRIRL